MANGYESQWNKAHAVHCFDVIFKAINCLSHATAEGWKRPLEFMEHAELFDRVAEASSQPQCRDFKELHRWTSEPVRQVPFYYNSGHKETAPVPMSHSRSPQD